MPSNTRIWLAAGVADMRRGVNTPAAQAEKTLEEDPYSGHLFVFRGRRGDLLKIIWWDAQGACLFSKRLGRGRFVWPAAKDGKVSLGPSMLAMLLAKSQALKIEKLQHQLAGHRKARFGSKSERADQLHLDLQEDSEIAAAAADQQGETGPGDEQIDDDKPGKRKHSRAPLPDHLERHSEVLSPGETCVDCGGTLRAPGEDVTQELDYIPGRFVVREIIRPRMACSGCEAFAQAPLPSRPITRGRAGPGLLAHVPVGKYCDHLPLHRQSGICAREKVDLHRSTLAATFGDERGLQECLRPGAITVLAGREPDPRLAGLLSGSMLPGDWTASALAARTSTKQVLQVPDRALSRADLTRFLFQQAPVLLPVARREDIPPLLVSVASDARVLDLAEIDADILVAVLTASHSATGRIDEDAVRAILPNDTLMAALESEQFAIALRARTACGVADRIAVMLGIPASPGQQTASSGIDPIEGTTRAHVAARHVVEDLRSWQDGEVAWTDMSRSLLIHGVPGSGKTYLARQISVAAGVGLVEGSFSAWQASGHLGQMLAAMTCCFDEAIAQAPCILFVDEIDAIGSRFDRDQHGINYRVQVINGFLQQIDRLNRAPGVVLIGACNQVDRMDPAITRPGRFDEIVQMPLPSQRDIARIIAKGTSEALDTDAVQQLAREAVGKTPAEIDAAIRAAKRRSRRERTALTADMLRSQLGLDRPDPALLHRIAVHESGHALGATLLNMGPVTRVSISGSGGLTERAPALRQLTVEEIEAELIVVMSGRAAERLLIGGISGGGGGSPQSD